MPQPVTVQVAEEGQEGKQGAWGLHAVVRGRGPVLHVYPEAGSSVQREGEGMWLWRKNHWWDRDQVQNIGGNDLCREPGHLVAGIKIKREVQMESCAS